MYPPKLYPGPTVQSRSQDLVTMMTTATKVNDDKAEEALHSMRTQLGLYSPQVFDLLIP